MASTLKQEFTVIESQLRAEAEQLDRLAASFTARGMAVTDNGIIEGVARRLRVLADRVSVK